jgi:hypothetical protein
MCRLDIGRLLRPGKRQRVRDVGGAVLLHKCGEIEQSFACIPERESQITPHAQILLNGLA